MSPATFNERVFTEYEMARGEPDDPDKVSGNGAVRAEADEQERAPTGVPKERAHQRQAQDDPYTQAELQVPEAVLTM